MKLTHCPPQTLAAALRLDGAPEQEAEVIVSGYRRALQASPTDADLTTFQLSILRKVLLPRRWFQSAVVLLTAHPDIPNTN